jgi:hypothetical protein
MGWSVPGLLLIHAKVMPIIAIIIAIIISAATGFG